MAVLKCDICDGSMTMDVGGEFATCDFCGMQHTKERLKIKLKDLPKDSDDQKNNDLFD